MRDIHPGTCAGTCARSRGTSTPRWRNSSVTVVESVVESPLLVRVVIRQGRSLVIWCDLMWLLLWWKLLNISNDCDLWLLNMFKTMLLWWWLWFININHILIPQSWVQHDFSSWFTNEKCFVNCKKIEHWLWLTHQNAGNYNLSVKHGLMETICFFSYKRPFIGISQLVYPCWWTGRYSTLPQLARCMHLLQRSSDRSQWGPENFRRHFRDNFWWSTRFKTLNRATYMAYLIFSKNPNSRIGIPRSCALKKPQANKHGGWIGDSKCRGIASDVYCVVISKDGNSEATGIGSTKKTGQIFWEIFRILSSANSSNTFQYIPIAWIILSWITIFLNFLDIPLFYSYG